jgi:putative oxidoreductase
LPAINKGELATLYSLVFLYVACRGGGKWSLDALPHHDLAQSER